MSKIKDILDGNSTKNAPARRVRLSTGDQMAEVPDYSYGFDYGHRKSNSTFNCRVVVVCGGCRDGRLPSGSDHADCRGSGVRRNRRYGRCGKNS